MLISIETHITCDFPGGGGPDPLSPSGSVRSLVWAFVVRKKKEIRFSGDETHILFRIWSGVCFAEMQDALFDIFLQVFVANV